MDSFWIRFFRCNARFLIRWLESLFPGPPIGVFVLFHVKGVTKMSDVTVHDDEVTLRSTTFGTDAEGVPTTFPSPPSYESSDETVAVIHPSEDGLTATYDIGTIGDAVVTVHTGVQDADGNEIIGKGTIHVVPGNVSVVGIDFATG